MTPQVRAIAPQERASVVQLLEVGGLPTGDLNEQVWKHFLVAVETNRVVGAIALEPHERSGLLRSLVVDPSRRHRGIGKNLVLAAESRASTLWVTKLYLLTNTAEDFFASLNYQRTSRENAPTAIQRHAQFRTLCPASAALMTKDVEFFHDQHVF